MFVILTPNQIQHGGFIRASVKKIGDMIRDRVRILYLLFLRYKAKFDKQGCVIIILL